MASLVSVVIPYWNRREYLATAIRSALATRHPKLEILVVDDGSTDGAEKIPMEFERGGAPIRRLHHPGGAHLGIAATRNLGFLEARGEFVSFLDSDDAFLPWRFEKVIPFLEKSGDLLAAYEPVRWVDADGLEPVLQMPETVGSDETDVTKVPERGIFDREVVLESLLAEAGRFWQMPGIVVRREMREIVGLFDPKFQVAEDTHLWIRLAFTGRVVCAQDQRAVALVRKHKGHSWAGIEGPASELYFLEALLGAIESAARAGYVPKSRLETGRRWLRWHFEDTFRRRMSTRERAGVGGLLRWAARREPRLILGGGVARAIARLAFGGSLDGQEDRNRRSPGIGTSPG